MNRRELISTMLVFLRGGTDALERELAKDTQAVNDAKAVNDFTSQNGKEAAENAKIARARVSFLRGAIGIATGKG